VEHNKASENCFIAAIVLRKRKSGPDQQFPRNCYLCEGFKCEKCGRFHVRQSEAAREIREEDRWLPSRHRAQRNRIRADQATRRGKEERVAFLTDVHLRFTLPRVSSSRL
jgi:hypothetical protein